jgi:hypothetical protein
MANEVKYMDNTMSQPLPTPGSHADRAGQPDHDEIWKLVELILHDTPRGQKRKIIARHGPSFELV